MAEATSMLGFRLPDCRSKSHQTLQGLVYHFASLLCLAHLATNLHDCGHKRTAFIYIIGTEIFSSPHVTEAPYNSMINLIVAMTPSV